MRDAAAGQAVTPQFRKDFAGFIAVVALFALAFVVAIWLGDAAPAAY